MDQPANDCPCKRQRVSEGDDVDQETGMLLDNSAGCNEYEDGTENCCGQRETTVGQTGDSVLERDTIQNDQFAGAAGDFQSNLEVRKIPDLFCIPRHAGDGIQTCLSTDSILEKDGNQSSKSNSTNQSAGTDSIAKTFENQSADASTGSQSSTENAAAGVVNCIPELDQSVGTVPRVQPNAGFCEYAQNIQAIAESSYIRNRERNMSKSQMEKLPKLESPKLKRPLDRINTNLAKKRMETAANPQLDVEESYKTSPEIKDKCNIFSHESYSPLRATSNENQDKTEDKKEAVSNEFLQTDHIAKDGANVSENGSAISARTFGENKSGVLNKVIDSVINEETESLNRTNNNIEPLAEGFDVSGFVEMFSNSVMGSIMNCNAGMVYCANSGRLGHTDGKERDDERIGNDDRSNRNAGDTDDGLELRTGDVIERDTEKHGHLLDDIDIDMRVDRAVQADRIDTLVGPTDLGLDTSGSINKSLISTHDMGTSTIAFNRLHESFNETAALVESTEQRANSLNTCTYSSEAVHTSASSSDVTVEAVEGTGPSEAFSNESNDIGLEVSDTDIARKGDTTNVKRKSTSTLIDIGLEVSDTDSARKGDTTNVKGKSTSALIDGRFKLDFEQTREIISQNNINSLPITVLVQILKNLTVFELLRHASCVCKYWYNLCRDPDIWRSICLVNQHRLSDKNLEKVLWFADYRVRNINLTDCRFLTNKGIKYLVMSCPQIEVLRVMRCFDITDVAFEGLYSLGLCSNLRALYMDGCCRITDNTVLEVSEACPQLRTLHLNQCTRISDNSITGIAQNCPHLTNLQLDHCSQVTDVAMSEIVLGCPDLLYLNLMCCGITDKGVKYLAKLSKLTNLDLSNIPRLTSDCVVYLSKFCKNLQCINVSLNTAMDDRCVAQLAMNLPVLKRLYCVSCSISDKGLEDIAKYRPTLEALDVGWCQEVTDHGVRVISLACKHLDYFGLIRCDRVTIETIEELVLKYPRINYSTFILESRRLLERARNEGYRFNLP